VLYSTTVKWRSTAPQVAAHLIVNGGHTRRGKKTIQAKNTVNKCILVAPHSPQQTLGTLFVLGLFDEGQELLPSVVIVVFVFIARRASLHAFDDALVNAHAVSARSVQKQLLLGGMPRTASTEEGRA